MEFKVNYHKIELNCRQENNLLMAEGLVDGEHKLLRFIPGSMVSLKFQSRSVIGQLVRFSKNNILISFEGKEKRVPYQDFIIQNSHVQVLIRLEKDGVGPYRQLNPSPALCAWVENERNLHTKMKQEEDRQTKPVPEEDPLLSQYILMGSLCQFAFRNYAQLFQWFSIQDITFLTKEGFKVAYKQKGLDYYDSFFSYHQAAYALTKDQFTKVQEVQKDEFFL